MKIMISSKLINESNIYKIYNLSELDQDTALTAVININDSVEWSNYNLFIIRNYFKENHIFFAVYAIDGKEEIAGYVTLSPRENHYYIPFIAVDQKKHSGKAGSHLMKAVIEKVQAIGTELLVLQCRHKSNLIKFYNRIAQDNQIQCVMKSDGFYSNYDQRIKVIYTLKKSTRLTEKEEISNSPSKDKLEFQM